MKDEKNILKWLDGNDPDGLADGVEDKDLVRKIAHYSRYIHTPIRDVEKGLSDVFEKSKKRETKVRQLEFRRILRVAAIILLMLVPAYFVLFNTTEYATGLAQTQNIKLPDNSEVILNADSDLSFKKRNWMDNRLLKLDGEAFFKVAKGETFKVITEQGSVEVLGTQFNVAERDGLFEIRCYEGKVRVTHKNSEYTLTRGKSFRFLNGEVLPMDDFDEISPSWLEQETTFVEIPVYMVIEEIERQFGVEIEAEGLDLSAGFTGGFRHDNLEAALQTVCIPLGLNYSISGNKVALTLYE